MKGQKMVKITNSDIDALIDATVTLEEFSNQVDDPLLKQRYHAQVHHVRKVYMFLLHFHCQKNFDFEKIMLEKVADDSPLGKAIDALCPLATTVN